MSHRCTDCGKVWSSEDALYKHKLDSLHKCEHCQHQFHSRNDVKQHMRTHKLYPCSVARCSRGFFLDSSLKQHMSNSTHVKKSRKRTRKRKQRASGVSTTSSVFVQSPPSPPSPPPPPPPPPPLFIQELERYASLGHFLEQVVVPDSENMSSCRKVIDDIVNFLHHRAGLDVAEVFKSGSLAKGTGIRLKNDIDLVMFLNNTTMADLKSGMKTRLIRLKDLLLENFDDKLTFIPGREVTGHSVQFELKRSVTDVPHAVDLLPAIDLTKNGPKEVYKEMRKDPVTRPYYSVCLAKFQVDFVKDQLKKSEDLRRLIRLVKHWKVREDLLELKSYSVELIVIKLWQKLGEPKNFDLKEKMTQVLREISKLGSMEIVWPKEYDVSEYGGLPPDNVIIMDPANPYGNTAKMLTREAVRRIEQRARETIQYL